MDAINALKILSREKNYITGMTSERTIGLLVKSSELHQEVSEGDVIYPHHCERVKVSEMALQNLLLNFTSVRSSEKLIGCVEGLVARLRAVRNNATEEQVPRDVRFFDLRLLFLLTALCQETRLTLRTNLEAAKVLYDVLIIYLNKAESLPASEQHKDLAEEKRSAEDVEIILELMKLIYNLSITLEKLQPTDVSGVEEWFSRIINLKLQEERMLSAELVKTSRRVLLSRSETPPLTDKLRGQAVNLLTGVSRSSYSWLLIPIRSDGEIAALLADKTYLHHRPLLNTRILTEFEPDSTSAASSSSQTESQPSVNHPLVIEFLGHNINAVVALLAILQKQLNAKSDIKTKEYACETIVPILSCLCEAAKASRIIRKFLRVEILPPLKDVTNRPEVGLTFRNRLCALLTSPITEVKDFVAELLFVLCKENGERGCGGGD